jgi:hypothetical protein
MNTVNPVQFNPKNPGLNLDPGSTNSSRIAPLKSFIDVDRGRPKRGSVAKFAKHGAREYM